MSSSATTHRFMRLNWIMHTELSTVLDGDYSQIQRPPPLQKLRRERSLSLTLVWSLPFVLIHLPSEPV